MESSLCYSTVERHEHVATCFEGDVDTLDLVLNWPISEVIYTEEGKVREIALSRSQSQTPVCESANATYVNSVGSSTELNRASVQKKRRTEADTSDVIISSKRRKSETVEYFPAEIISMLISQLLTAKPKCALNLVAPDWNMCRGEAAELDNSVAATRILTYTRGVGISRAGTLSCRFTHGDNDHIATPIASFDPRLVTLGEGFTTEYIRLLYRTHTHVFTLGINKPSSDAMIMLPGDNWGNVQPFRSELVKAILPFDDEPTNSPKMKAYPTSSPIYKHLRNIAVHSPLNLMHTNASAFESNSNTNKGYNALDRDRSAHLWLSWAQMPNLESVFLDLRIYSHDSNTERRCLSKFEIIARAREMGRRLRLKTLVLAGLQSYSFYVAYNGESAHNIEQLDTLDGEPNWIKIFRPTVREGGQIVLVDRLTD
ncbi:hypothetical protein F5B22DRAFT_659282 [Xylaria bambusicola]|uniref:uncharacterized protein n=1 Tax=Xylaria bambusicola TaxID=326684 RepID=UPI002008584F|nr:uncharacterized protein F5B22DRAFT_659282 [Xylaria bambusicola]KAI0508520.1 hypothetical protein F5B22DRAFT_659282 [Xylaria bambusicola]